MGERVRLVEVETVREIVGVLADVLPLNPDEPVRPQIYWPQAQYPRLADFMVIRSEYDTEILVPEVRERLTTLDPDLSLGAFRSMDDWLGIYLATPRFSMALVGIFALVALIRASVGIYGVMPYGVSRRTHEIGLRISLGPTAGDIVRLVVAGSLRLAVFGIVIGAVRALGLTRLLTGMLAGVPPWDPATFAGTALSMAALAIVSGYVPARRASKVQPVEALRVE